MWNVEDTLNMASMKLRRVLREDKTRFMKINQLSRLLAKGIEYLLKLKTRAGGSFAKKEAIVSKKQARYFCFMWGNFETNPRFLQQ